MVQGIMRPIEEEILNDHEYKKLSNHNERRWETLYTFLINHPTRCILKQRQEGRIQKQIENDCP